MITFASGIPKQSMKQLIDTMLEGNRSLMISFPGSSIARA
jgi:hypothetical protein